MKNKLYLAITTVVLIGFYACSGTGKNAAADSAATNASAKQPIDTADLRLANDLSIFCQNQIEAAKMAETKASSQDIQNFAKQNAKLYEELSGHLNQISESYQIKLPADLSTATQKNLQDLKDVKGASFDHAYLLRMLKDHNATIREYNAAKNIQCIPLKMFVGSNQAAIIKQAYTISDLKDKTP